MIQKGLRVCLAEEDSEGSIIFEGEDMNLKEQSGIREVALTEMSQGLNINDSLGDQG